MNQIVNKMFQPGDVGFLMHHDNKLSKIIAWFMQSRWSHSFLVAEPTRQEIYLVETSDFQVGFGSLLDYLKDDSAEFVVYRPKNILDDERQEIVDRAKKQRNKIYGYLQLISLGIRRLLMRINIKINNFFHQGLVCTHVITYGYHGSNIPELSKLDPESIDTEELYQIVKNSVNFELIFEKKAKL